MPVRGVREVDCETPRSRWDLQTLASRSVAIPPGEEAFTPHCKYYAAVGIVCSISTNFEPLLGAAGEALLSVAAEATADLRLSFWVDTQSTARAPWPKPYFRGLNHLVFAAYSPEDAMLIDLAQRRAIGRFSAAMAADRSYWKQVIFPALLGVMGASAGVTALHCGCVVRNGAGLLLAGDSGSGKSTLALALCKSGFDLLADDWTYLTTRSGRLAAWGLPTALKLLPDARTFFPELRWLETTASLNGELAYEIDPEVVFGVRRSSSCQPRCVVFLERGGKSSFSIAEMSSTEAARRFESLLEDLPAELSHYRVPQDEAIRQLVARPCRVLRYAEGPEAVAWSLRLYCENL